MHGKSLERLKMVQYNSSCVYTSGAKMERGSVDHGLFLSDQAPEALVLEVDVKTNY